VFFLWFYYSSYILYLYIKGKKALSYGLCPMVFVPWSLSHGLCPMVFVLWLLSYGRCPMAFVLWSLSYGFCPMVVVLWFLSYGFCWVALSYGFCPMAFVGWIWLRPDNCCLAPIPDVYTGLLIRTSGPVLLATVVTKPLDICRVSISRNEWGIDL